MFLRNNTNKQYSLRRLKKGTASVAVALAVLGAGVTTSQTVKAESVGRFNEDQVREARDKAIKDIFDGYTGARSIYQSGNLPSRLTPTKLSQLMQGMYKELLQKKEELKLVSKEFHNTINKKIESDNANKQRIGELKQEIKDLQEAMQGVADTLSQASHKVSELSTQNKALQAEAEVAAQKLWMHLTIKTSKSQNW
ncbi:YSIRK-type signal peptide-containing protein [Streptococcus equi subsp. zooepidemicus]|nr:YSIRK-type signal peptide-containing protein [Streptococcus equi]MCD3463551.1 YSIRK-type signal peptide-containing protein [Streptococcus equi subsp. zooepidemicus]